MPTPHQPMSVLPNAHHLENTDMASTKTFEVKALASSNVRYNETLRHGGDCGGGGGGGDGGRGGSSGGGGGSGSHSSSKVTVN